MPIGEAMRTQRAIRKLRPDPLDNALVLELIEFAMKAPSGSNAQNWGFVVVRDRRAMAQLARLNRMAWGLYARVARYVKRNDEKSTKLVTAGQYFADHFEETPVVVVACLRGRAPWFPLVAATSFYGSIYPAVQNLLLAARAVGVGANLITLPLWNVRGVKRAIGLPCGVTPCALIPLGWPLGRYGPTSRSDVGDVVHLDRWGNQPFRK